MGEQVGGHEGAVGVAADGDPPPVRHAAADHLVDRRLGRGHELLHVGVVRLLRPLAHDRHARVVQHRIAAGQPDQRRARAGAREAVGGVGDLPRRVGALELLRIGPHQHRQRAVRRLPPRGRVEGRRELHAVRALVADQLLVDAGELRRRVREAGELAGALAAGEIADVSSWASGRPSRGVQELLAAGVEQVDRDLVVGRRGAEEPARSLRLVEVEGVEERPVPLGGGARAERGRGCGRRRRSAGPAGRGRRSVVSAEPGSP